MPHHTACALILIPTLLAGSSAVAQPASDVAARNKALVQERFDAWKAGTVLFDSIEFNEVWDRVQPTARAGAKQ